MNIVKRRQIVWHTLIFLVFSILYLYIEKSLSISVTAIDLTSFINYLNESKLLIILFFVAALSIYSIKKISKIILLFVIGYILYLMILVLYSDFNKLNFIITMIYLLIAGYFYIFWSLELAKALYNPIFTLNDLDIRSLVPIKVSIKQNDICIIAGHLCNWDEDSCFVLIDSFKEQGVVLNEIRKNKKITVEFFYSGKVFTNDGEICAISDELKGLGIELKIDLNKINSPQFSFDFVLLYSTLSKMGFVPKEYYL